ncbi:hypothetical protein M408DRAFT_328278 [Serendipita vermifera MAFF 305830]|uniref:DUF6533 domain-containing protein n=1 Tax=Serendipita vermifera MAFF 305830 TaxID=933852 RepID=A0A0C3BFI8_SERVB|nr:hypothetical protein M408DRAFT_328278 [Serendipita vermifera MAFF 305830]
MDGQEYTYGLEGLGLALERAPNAPTGLHTLYSLVCSSFPGNPRSLPHLAFMDIDVAALFHNIYTTRYTALAAVTLALYDWFLVLDDEIQLVGKASFSKGKLLYYITRFATPIGLILGFCYGFMWFTTILEVFSIFISYWLLTLRIVALYKSRPVVIWLLHIALLASYFTTLGMLIQSLRLYSSSLAYLPSLNFCVPLIHPPSLAVIFEVPLVYETLLVVLTAWHAWKDYYRGRELTQVQMIPLMKIMYRDGVFYFCIMVAVRVWNIYVYASKPIYEMFVGVYIIWSLITVLACRIYLNIAREARRNNPPWRLSATSIRPLQDFNIKSDQGGLISLEIGCIHENHVNSGRGNASYEVNSAGDSSFEQTRDDHVLDIRRHSNQDLSDIQQSV